MKTDLSLIIPVLRWEGNPYLEGLLKALGEQTLQPLEVHLVVGDRRQGRAINYGASQCKGTWLGTLDDDSFIEDPKLLEKIVEALTQDDSIGLAGAACEIPPWASAFQKRAMREIPRRFFPVQSETVESDMVQHPCLVMSRELFQHIGGEDEELIRGLDPVLRKKVRDAHKKVVIVKNTAVFHLLPARFFELLKMYYRNGRGSGYAQRHFPERVLELSDGYDAGTFVEKRPFLYRLGRRLLHWFGAALAGRWIQWSTDGAYGLGVLVERCYPSSVMKAPRVKKVNSELQPGYPFQLWVHRVQLEDLKNG
jgi:glycosyltransferase involved in cell wall biosynthesis